MQNFTGEVVGTFQLDKRLADGGTASVYKATMLYPEANSANPTFHVALKITRSDVASSDVFADLLTEEIRTLNDCRHPGVVRICPMVLYNKPRYRARADNLPGKPWYFVMELLGGGTLYDVISGRNQKFSLPWRLELLYQVTVILDYLHARRLSHRDLKPDNIMFRVSPRPNEIPVPVLIDFGLTIKAKLEAELEEKLPQTHAVTPSYASPERLQNLPVSNAFREPTGVNIDHAKADMWSLGVIAYELLCGYHPFDDMNQRAVLNHRILHEPPRQMPPDIPPKVQHMVAKMLEKDPSYRINSFDLIRMLETEIEYLPPRIENGD